MGVIQLMVWNMKKVNDVNLNCLDKSQNNVAYKIIEDLRNKNMIFNDQ